MSMNAKIKTSTFFISLFIGYPVASATKCHEVFDESAVLWHSQNQYDYWANGHKGHKLKNKFIPINAPIPVRDFPTKVMYSNLTGIFAEVPEMFFIKDEGSQFLVEEKATMVDGKLSVRGVRIHAIDGPNMTKLADIYYELRYPRIKSVRFLRPPSEWLSAESQYDPDYESQKFFLDLYDHREGSQESLYNGVKIDITTIIADGLPSQSYQTTEKPHWKTYGPDPYLLSPKILRPIYAKNNRSEHAEPEDKLSTTVMIYRKYYSGELTEVYAKLRQHTSVSPALQDKWYTDEMPLAHEAIYEDFFLTEREAEQLQSDFYDSFLNTVVSPLLGKIESSHSTRHKRMVARSEVSRFDAEVNSKPIGIIYKWPRYLLETGLYSHLNFFSPLTESNYWRPKFSTLRKGFTLKHLTWPQSKKNIQEFGHHNLVYSFEAAAVTDNKVNQSSRPSLVDFPKLKRAAEHNAAIVSGTRRMKEEIQDFIFYSMWKGTIDAKTDTLELYQQHPVVNEGPWADLLSSEELLQKSFNHFWAELVRSIYKDNADADKGKKLLANLSNLNSRIESGSMKLSPPMVHPRDVYILRHGDQIFRIQLRPYNEWPHPDKPGYLFIYEKDGVITDKAVTDSSDPFFDRKSKKVPQLIKKYRKFYALRPLNKKNNAQLIKKHRKLYASRSLESHLETIHSITASIQRDILLLKAWK